MDRLGIIQKLFAAYPNTTAGMATFAVYLEVMEDAPTDELHAVVMQCIRESNGFPPSAGDLLERWRKMRSGVTPDKAQEGWASVQKAILGVGMWGTPSFKDPIVKRVVDAFGWLNLCMSENQMADRAQFVKFYEAFARQQVDEQRLSTEYRQMRDQHHSNQVEDRTNGTNIIIKRLSD